jgi:hypothetical protein
VARKSTRQQWYRADIHIHTPASLDYHDTTSNFIDILQRAEYRGMDMIAFTDHNTVNGYAAMMHQIEQLAFLQDTGRATLDEQRILAEYQRLLDKMLVLPGFEFTATFGFHILGIFAPQTPMRLIEHILLSLNVPADVLERGDTAAGSTADVLEAYRLIDEAGGLAIAAHINSAHGVMMKGLSFGGQTRMAYTQDRHLHALELTDLGKRGRTTTRSFFNGTRPEYPRRMHCIQNSDAHSLDTFMEGKNVRFGVGERATEFALRERSFEALKEVLLGTDFARVRPYTPDKQPYDFILAAREEGASLVQSFHETFDKKSGRLQEIVADVCAFANTNGGTVYVGLSANKNDKPVGISAPNDAIKVIRNEISRSITPRLDVELDAPEVSGKPVIRILVPAGEERPYAVSDNQIYVRDEAETGLAVRDEIVNLVRQGLERQGLPANVPARSPRPAHETSEIAAVVLPQAMPTDAEGATESPRAGVEIASVEDRGDTRYYTMRDLRNGSMVTNVTQSSARRLWHYAIKQHTTSPVIPDKVEWHGDIGMWKRYEKSGDTRYDLVQRTNGDIRVYYGVTDIGMHGRWAEFLEGEEGE